MLLCFAVFGLGAAWARANAEAIHLVGRSPFEPPEDIAEAKASAAEAVLELRGMIEEDHRYLFSVYEVASKRSVWIAEGEATRAIQVQAYDSHTGTLQVSFKGRLIALVLRDSQPQGAALAVVVPGGLRHPTPQAPIPPAAAPLAEVQRLAPLVAEIQRRQASIQNSTPR